MVRGAGIVLGLAVAACPLVALAEEAEEGEFELLQRLRDQFRAGEYEEAIGTGESILTADPSRFVRAETHQYVGASAELLGRTAEAEEHFEELLTLQPSFRLEQAEFPTEVLAVFDNVRLRMEDRLRLIEERRRAAQEAERRERERRLREEQERIALLSRPRYMEREVRRRHLAVAFLPFGAGQFQNDHIRRGFTFMGVQLGLTGASMALWLLQATAPEDSVDGPELLFGYQVASYVVYGALAVSVIWGIVDALVNFSPETERWTEIDETDVPEEHRLGVEATAQPATTD